ncbi:helix-turn-helix domain-containing protein [Nonomuraea endophytica]|uniref:Transcriptional regulator with XRE-family HTH domain n=1 Tax=Nonomuraea endophytica TaxID=714136 RepID=A0A7W8ELR7_9ACTN|nr:helix-turn-helix transcriptional regulator [Nonomuraea endophytica]MBB5083172.1 transcriptional regulator with XRE-family HTH domain [Nonomuraea endophytica]
MSEQAASAKKAFGVRLRDLRKDAGLTGRQLATAAGLHNTKISRIEHGQQNPSEDDIRAWCIACGVARMIPELIAVQREIEQMWVEWRRHLRAGQQHIQSRAIPLYESTKLLCVYESVRIPGILQTPRYIRALFSAASTLYGLPDGEAEAAVAGRIPRQRLVTAGTGRNRYSFLVEAMALDVIIGNVDVMREQYNLLLEISALPHVSLGIIPRGQVRSLYPGEGFYIFDGQLVRSEMWSGGFRSNQSEEIETFLRAFAMLRGLAVYGAAARWLIEDARSRLQTRENL